MEQEIIDIWVRWCIVWKSNRIYLFSFFPVVLFPVDDTHSGMPYIRPMPPISAVAGKTMTIKCPVAGYPIESIVWEKDNTRLPTNMWQRVTNGVLSVENVQRTTDQGTYSCLARNKHNYTSQRTVNIAVLGKFSFQTHPPPYSPTSPYVGEHKLWRVTFYAEEGRKTPISLQVVRKKACKKVQNTKRMKKFLEDVKIKQVKCNFNSEKRKSSRYQGTKESHGDWCEESKADTNIIYFTQLKTPCAATFINGESETLKYNSYF